MHIKELHRLAKMANTKAKVSIFISDEKVEVRWKMNQPGDNCFQREIPWTALEEDRAPYRSVREYLKMSSLYMEGLGGTPDRDSELFQSIAPPANVLRLVSADLFPGDVVKSTGHWPDKTVDHVVAYGCDYHVYWRSGNFTRYGLRHVHEVVRS